LPPPVSPPSDVEVAPHPAATAPSHANHSALETSFIDIVPVPCSLRGGPVIAQRFPPWTSSGSVCVDRARRRFAQKDTAFRCVVAVHDRPRGRPDAILWPFGSGPRGGGAHVDGTLACQSCRRALG
jgi:hypothetical protein